VFSELACLDGYRDLLAAAVRPRGDLVALGAVGTRIAA